MFRQRIIPCLLLEGQGLVKTVRFRNPTYVGDPRNAVKIFNEKEVDELLILDIAATRDNRSPDLSFIEEVVSEAFMPIGYGGGIRTAEKAKEILRVGVEKVVLSTTAVEEPDIIRELNESIGSQSVVACIDVKKGRLGRYETYTRGGRTNTKLDPVLVAQRVEELGAGEIIVNSIDRDGTMSGYDTALMKRITESVTVPVIACGGAGKLEDFSTVIKDAGVSAVAAGSFFVFHGKHRAVLISYPEQSVVQNLLEPGPQKEKQEIP